LTGRCDIARIRICSERKYSVGMCGRFTLHTPESRLWEAFHLEQSAPLGLKPRYNIAPTQPVPIIRDTEAGREMVMARWGLVPHWSKEPRTTYSTINARIETVAVKPVYRSPFRHRRCLIPADGFYEWKVFDGRKVPHHIRMKDGDVFALAGLWDRWEGGGEYLDSCSIIVMPANAFMKPLHERMPAIIAPAHYDLWLDPRVTDKAEILAYLDSAPSEQLFTYPISPWVNSPRHDDERCIQPSGAISPG
jgi:putative SOS response-associated peptidase YedK